MITLESAQQILNQAGYDAGKVDGVWGPQTAQALARFQADQDLLQTGALDQPTSERLLAVKRKLDEKWPWWLWVTTIGGTAIAAYALYRLATSSEKKARFVGAAREVRGELAEGYRRGTARTPTMLEQTHDDWRSVYTDPTTSGKGYRFKAFEDVRSDQITAKPYAFGRAYKDIHYKTRNEMRRMPIRSSEEGLRQRIEAKTRKLLEREDIQQDIAQAKRKTAKQRQNEMVARVLSDGDSKVQRTILDALSREQEPITIPETERALYTFEPDTLPETERAPYTFEPTTFPETERAAFEPPTERALTRVQFDERTLPTGAETSRRYGPRRMTLTELREVEDEAKRRAMSNMFNDAELDRYNDLRQHISRTHGSAESQEIDARAMKAFMGGHHPVYQRELRQAIDLERSAIMRERGFKK